MVHGEGHLSTGLTLGRSVEHHCRYGVEGNEGSNGLDAVSGIFQRINNQLGPLKADLHPDFPPNYQPLSGGDQI